MSTGLTELDLLEEISKTVSPSREKPVKTFRPRRSEPGLSDPTRRSAFTLIELLVVIAIIAIRRRVSSA